MSLLLTGATGLVGRLLLEETGGLPVLAVARRPLRLDGPGRVILGDLADPSFHLDAHAHEITEIIHCAAAVRFDLPLAEARAINTEATVRLLNLARRAPRLRKFTHVSTVYVMGNDEGRLPEGPYQALSYPNTYEQSKAEAEQHVLAAARDLPVQVVRLSSIAGNARTGVVTQFNHVHQLLKLFPRRIFPVAPGHADLPVDLIAEDWTVPALWHLHQHGFVPGSVAHLSAGPGAAIRLGDMMSLCAEIFDCPPPELVPLPEFDRFLKRRLGGLTGRLMEALGLFLPHLGRDQSFLNADTLARLPQPPPSVESFLPSIVHYCRVGEPVLAAR
ncbi:MAG: SDR family oxidoreductase [Bryobacteraceae bacterium]|nr:SDR family oxidoreductase [Bryobacteraceae bacterium]